MEGHGDGKGRAEYRFPVEMEFWGRYTERLLSGMDCAELLDDVLYGRPGECRLHADGVTYDIRPLATGGLEAVRRNDEGRVDFSALLMATDDGSMNVYTSGDDAPGAEVWSRSAAKRLLADIYILNRACRELRPLVEGVGEAS